MSAIYMTSTGKHVTADDPKRMIWYGITPCSFWTDDWSTLRRWNGIPICPVCSAPGMWTEAEKWEKGVADFTVMHARYDEFMQYIKGHCLKQSHGVGDFLRLYDGWMQGNLIL